MVLQLGTCCITLASLRRPDREGLQGVFLSPIVPPLSGKNNAADRPSPVDHRPQEVIQRVLSFGFCVVSPNESAWSKSFECEQYGVTSGQSIGP